MRKALVFLPLVSVLLAGCGGQVHGNTPSPEPVLPVRPSNATTYYVSQSLGNDANAGTSPQAPWQNLSKIQSSTFQPGDTILLYRGDTWRERLLFPSSGSAGKPITITSYGYAAAKPLVKESDVVSSWAIQTPPNIWKASFTPNPDTPQQLFRNGQRMRLTGSLRALVADNQWFFDTSTNTAYVDSLINPNSLTMEISTRGYCIYLSNQSYVTIDNLDCRHGNQPNSGVFVIDASTPVSGITITNTDVSYAQGYGILFYNLVGGSLSGVTITNVTADHNGAVTAGGEAGLAIGGAGGGMISNVRITGGRYSYNGIHGDPNVGLIGNSGILLWDTLTATLTNVEMDHNGCDGINMGYGTQNVTITGGSAHDNGGSSCDSNNIGITGGLPSSGVGGPSNYVGNLTISSVDIYGGFRDAIEAASDNSFHGSFNLTVQYCRIRTSTSASQDGSGSGIHWGGPISGTNVIQYNLIYNNDDSGIWLVTGSSGSPTGVLIYGNTIWGNGASTQARVAGIWLATSPGIATTIKNNLVGNNGAFEINDDGNNATSDYNDFFHSLGGTFMRRGSVPYTFAGWKTASSQDSHSITTDPLVQSYANFDFRPTSASPLNNAGVALGPPYSLGLDPRGSFPFSTVAQQSSSNYTIGAFVYLPFTGEDLFSEITLDK